MSPHSKTLRAGMRASSLQAAAPPRTKTKTGPVSIWMDKRWVMV
jgi:hypothetical protein